MTLTNSRYNVLSAPDLPNYAAERLSKLQADVVSTARMWAVDEVGATIAHQLSGPLTALLLYLHEIKERNGQSVDAELKPNSMSDMLEQALRETERACEIMQRIEHTFAGETNAASMIEGPGVAKGAIASGGEAIDISAQSTSTKSRRYWSLVPSHSLQHLLTPRELEVLDMIIGGASNKEGGYKLGISTRTFEVHRAHIMEKLGAKNAADLVRMAMSETR